MLEAILLILGLTYLLIGLRRGLRYLRFFQQQDYIAKRYFAWILSRQAIDMRFTMLLVCYTILSGLCCWQDLYWLLIPLTIIYGVICSFVALSEEDPRHAGKIPLNMTERATRIYQLSMVLHLAVIIGFSFVIRFIRMTQEDGLTWIPWTNLDTLIFVLVQLLWIHIIPLLIPLANFFLMPLENSIQQEFRLEAEEIFAMVKPFVVGITGSYGKTSTKTILASLMNTCLAPTFWPPKSYNSIMGITKEIRGHLKSAHKYALIEMGAYGVGSIKNLCEFTPPQAGLITAVGIMHLERFGSAEAVYQAKRELAEAIPSDGILVVNGDDPGARRVAEECPKRITLRYGLDNERRDLDCWLQVTERSEQSTRFTVHWKGEQFSRVSTQLLGEAALSNIAAAFCMCVALGAQPSFVIAAVPNIEGIENRLSLRRDGQVRFLQDAYNSNPRGFRIALKVLHDLPAKRRILMTPGMIELGSEQFNENRNIAEEAAKICDLVLIVGRTNRKAIVEGLKKGGLAEDKIFTVGSRTEAFGELSKQRQDGDLILIENDLSDLYEMDMRF